ncbi:hypothetical protein [Streptomyces sp. NPDC051546]|uniref:hypothetical protein n=1 Tax=Streptomyces sp. NPDC051546 TaxID=3365655 RepID=UPI0037906A81
MDRTRSLVNRLVLFTPGALLLAIAVPLLTRNTPAEDRLPGRWKAFAGSDRWVPAHVGETWSGGHPLAGAAGIAVLILLAGAAGGLLLLQGRRGALRRLPLPSPGTVLETRALTAAVSSRLRSLPGVRSVRTVLRGTADGAHLRIRVVLEDSAPPRELLTVLSTAALPEARAFLAPCPLAAEVRFTVRPGSRPRRGQR